MRTFTQDQLKALKKDIQIEAFKMTIDHFRSPMYRGYSFTPGEIQAWCEALIYMVEHDKEYPMIP